MSRISNRSCALQPCCQAAKYPRSAVAKMEPDSTSTRDNNLQRLSLKVLLAAGRGEIPNVKGMRMIALVSAIIYYRGQEKIRSRATREK